MKSLIGPGILASLSLVLALSAAAQTQSATPSHPDVLSAATNSSPATADYNYDFISKGYVWSNKPLKSTASKICKTMRNHAFSETPYAINDDQDWNSCLDTQIRSIGYIRWLRNDYGFKANSRNRKTARVYLQKNYTMGPWGSYTFAQLQDAVKTAKGQ